VDLGKTLTGLMALAPGSGRVMTQEVSTFKGAIRWLFDQARKGQSIQRTRPGRNDPEQLWDTTINRQLAD